MAKTGQKTVKTPTKRATSAKNTAKKPVKSPKAAAIPEAAPIAEKPPAELQIQYEEVSILALSRIFNIDRVTIRDRIEKAGIKPVSVKINEKLYALDEKLEMVIRQDELAEAKLKKLELEGEKLEHDLAIKRGEFASVSEFTEIIQKVFGRLHKRVVVQLPKRTSKRLHEANSSAELAQFLETELAKEFNDLRSDFTKFL
jgi:hypothetical protein